MPWKDDDKKGQGGAFEYVFTVTSSKAGYTTYNEGKTCLLILEGEKEYANGNVKDDKLWINVPDNQEGTFEPADDAGTHFVHTSGDPKVRFSPRSKIQTFIRSALEAGVPLEERGDSSLDAGMWTGLKLRIREEPRTGGKGAQDWQQPLVIEYLGEVGSAGGSSAAPSSSANGSGDVKAAATVLAKESDNVVTYLERAAKELGLQMGNELMTTAFYESVNA